MFLVYRNINDGFRGLVQGFLDKTIPTEEQGSRNGKVIRSTSPVLITFNRPSERVLFNSSRDVNPYSILYECLWTLAGRNDVNSIAYYTPRMKEYSDDGTTWHGAYGHRWRHHFGRDQLNSVIQQLKDSRESRRVVLQMWDARVDGFGNGKDYPCNTQIYFSVKLGKLDITVCNRSNDMIWGLCGTNYPLFSLLLEYVSTSTNIPIGRYHHFTNDLHVYDWNWKPTEWLADSTYPQNYSVNDSGQRMGRYIPLVKDPAVFDKEVVEFVDRFSGKLPPEELAWEWTEPFLADVAQPMLIAWACHKEKDYHGALNVVADMESDDWRIACTSWLERRNNKHEKSHSRG